jgi:hypothetical protein
MKKNISLSNIDERTLCAYLCNKNNLEDFEILYDLYKNISQSALRSKNYEAYQLKLQWFISALQSDGDSTNISTIKNVCNKYNIDIYNILLLIEAKNIDMNPIPFISEDALITYAKNTGGLLWWILAQVLIKNPEKYKDKIIATGTAFAILGIIRNANFNQQRNIYTLIYTAESVSKNINDIKQKNINSLIIKAKSFIKESRTKTSFNPKLNRFLSLNLFTEFYINKLAKQPYTNIKDNLEQKSKIFYLKYICSYLLRRY